MKHEIESFSTPIEQFLKEIDFSANDSELDFFEASIICGLIKKVVPHKVLIIGGDSGHTTSILMKSIDALNYNNICNIFNINNFNCSIHKNQIGYLIGETTLFLNNTVQCQLIDNDTPEVIEQIGKEIDIVVILPSPTPQKNILDFLSVHPFLSQDSFVCFINNKKSNITEEGNYSFNNALINSIVADNIIPLDLNSDTNISNIRILKVTNDTFKYIENCFFSLNSRWFITPNDKLMAKYRDLFSRKYNAELLKIFDFIIEHNKYCTPDKENITSRFSISYRIGLAITYIPRLIHDTYLNNNSGFPAERKMIKKNARKKARSYHLKNRSYIFSDSNTKALFFLPNIRKDFIQQSIFFNNTYFEIDNLSYITKQWCHGLIGRKIKNKVILDIGSNIGNHTLYFLIECEAKKVHCFEPIKSTFQTLKTNIVINHLEERVCLHNVAVGECNGKASITHYEKDNIGATELKEESNGTIDIIAIDDINFSEDLSLIKIDVEGFETKVIKGMTQTLKKHHPFILIEIQDYNFSSIINILQPLGYFYKHIEGIDYLFFHSPALIDKY